MATCKVCSFQYADTEPRCPRCGFGSATSSMAAPPTAAPPTAQTGPAQPAAFVNLVPGVSVGPSGVSVAAPRRKGILILVVLILLAIPIAGLVLAATAINKVTDVVIPGVQELFEQPGPGDSNTSGTGSISPAQCEEILSLYLKKMFFALDKDPDKISALFIEASGRLGPSSQEYRDLVEIFSSQELSGLAATGHPAKAFKKAKPLIQKKCKG